MWINLYRGSSWCDSCVVVLIVCALAMVELNYCCRWDISETYSGHDVTFPLHHIEMYKVCKVRGTGHVVSAT